MELINRTQGIIELERYFEYLDGVRSRLPQGARNFVNLSYHYDFSDKKCPHDSWLEYINIYEEGLGPRKNERSISIKSRFLGAYQDGHFEIIYHRVSKYTAENFACVDLVDVDGHGDWLIDEVILLQSGEISHEIEFSHGIRWKIVCEDLSYSWLGP